VLKSIIVAVAENGVIGKDNDLIWHLPEDMAFFKQTTKGHCVIMGRKNYESIPEKFRPLPGRTNIVISRNTAYNAPGCVLCSSLDEALKHAESTGETEAFIIGGGQIYKTALSENLVDRLYITHIHKAYEGDTFFPSMSADLWQKKALFSHPTDEKHEAGFTVFQYDKIA
jgi:dihydrofolate reductase